MSSTGHHFDWKLVNVENVRSAKRKRRQLTLAGGMHWRGAGWMEYMKPINEPLLNSID